MFTSTSLFPEVIPISINSNFWFQFYALIGWSLRTFQGIFFLLMATDVAAWDWAYIRSLLVSSREMMSVFSGYALGRTSF